MAGYLGQPRLWRFGRAALPRDAAGRPRATVGLGAAGEREGLHRAGAAVGGVPALLLQVNVQAELLDLPDERLGLANLALPHLPAVDLEEARLRVRVVQLKDGGIATGTGSAG